MKKYIYVALMVSSTSFAWAISDYFADFVYGLKVGLSHVSGYDYNLEVGTAVVTSDTSNSAGIGSYLTTNTNGLTVGQWNKSVPGALLVVGNGTGTGDKKNALEVYSNGKIVINSPQGDINVGIYGGP